MDSTRWQHCAWLFLVSLLLALPLRAEISLQLGDVQAAGWQARGVTLSLADAQGGGYTAQLRIERLSLPGGDWRMLSLSCPAMQWDEGYRCADARLTAEGPHGPQSLQGSFEYRDAENWQAAFDGLRLAGGDWRLQGRADGDWRLVLHGQGASVAGVLGLLPAGSVPAWEWQGGVAVSLELHGRDAELLALAAHLKLSSGGYASPDGLQAAEGLTGEARLQARHSDGDWAGQGSLSIRAGQGYSDPVFLDLAGQPLQLAWSGRWQPADGSLYLAQGEATLGGLLQLHGQGQLLPLTQSGGQLAVRLSDLAALYPVLLQPLAYGTAFDSLDVAGGLTAALAWQGEKLQSARVELQDVHLDDQEGRFGISGLAGTLAWRDLSGQTPQDSLLAWRSGSLYRIGFGASRVSLQLQGDSLKLTHPLSLPLLAGQLHVPRMSVAGLGSDQLAWHTALVAEELSLPELTAALGWPIFEGNLSVQIPAVSYARGGLDFEGELVAEAFDGTVRVNGLRLTDPFGAVPGLQAEASLRGLDLERLTRVFELGRITGRLDGDVRGLELVGWEPVSFQAELRTPPGDESRHRISQRAVENLTALGNNGAAALSGTFLRVFESFAYDRLLLKVDLSGQVARLDGIAHPDGGYYLVKGSGLPRIDVIGRNRQVAWRDLVERLKRIRRQGVQAGQRP